MKQITELVSGIAQGRRVALWDAGIFIDALAATEMLEVEAVVLPHSTKGIFASGYLTAALKYAKGGGNVSEDFMDLPAEDQESIILVICAMAQVLEMKKHQQTAMLLAGRVSHLKWMTDQCRDMHTVH